MSPIVPRRSRSGPGTGRSGTGTSPLVRWGRWPGTRTAPIPTRGRSATSPSTRPAAASPPAARAARVPRHPRRATDDSPDLHDAGGVWSVDNEFGPVLTRVLREGECALDYMEVLRRLAINDERFAEGCVAGAGSGRAPSTRRRGAVPSYGAEADAPVSAGATGAEIVEMLVGIVSVVGLPSVVAAANAVVETNAHAIRLWESLGFKILATVPEAFRRPDRGLVGLHIMHRLLGWSMLRVQLKARQGSGFGVVGSVIPRRPTLRHPGRGPDTQFPRPGRRVLMSSSGTGGGTRPRRWAESGTCSPHRSPLPPRGSSSG